MRNRGRPKGSETSVIGVPRKRQRSLHIWERSKVKNSSLTGATNENCSVCGLYEPSSSSRAKKKITWLQCDLCRQWLHCSCVSKETLPKTRHQPFKCQFCC